MKTETLMAERQQVEQALGESEQRYRRLIAATTDYIYTVTVENGRVTGTSHGPGCAAVTGYTSAEFAADTYLWYRVIHPEDRDAVVAQAAWILTGKEPPPLEHRLIHKLGRVRWVRNTTIPHRNAEGQLIAYDGLITDITSRKRAEMFVAVEHAVTAALAPAATLAVAWPQVLESLGSILLWHGAAMWTWDAPKAELHLEGVWGRAPLRPEAVLDAENCRAAAPEKCLRARVAASGEPLWVFDAATAHRTGDLSLFRGPPELRSGCIVPFRIDGTIGGLVEVWTRESLPSDAELMRVLVNVASHVGQFLERQRALDNLQRERHLLRTVVDNLPDCIFVKDAQSRLLLSNTAHLKLLGETDPQKVLGKTDYDFFPAELASQYRADEAAVIQSGQALSNREEPVVDREARHLWLLTTKVPLKNSGGKTFGVVGIARDITEHKAAEEKLQQNRQLLGRSQAIAHVGSWELDLAADLLTWSPEAYRIFGVEPDKTGLNYKTFLECVHPDDRAKVDKAYCDSVCAGRDTYEIEHRVIRNTTGEVRIVHEKCEHVRDAGGKIVRSIGMVQDITERKRAANQLQAAYGRLARRDLILKAILRRLKASHKELKQTQKQLIQAAKLESIGTLAAGVAHQVKNPLQTILLGIHFLTQKFACENEDVTLTLADMRDAVSRATAIIRELLDLSAATDFHRVPGNLNAVIERALLLMQNEFIAARVEVIRQLASALPPVLMDAGKLEQVFINFFINATQAMPSGGTLTLATRSVRLDHDAAARGVLFGRFRPGDRVVIAEVSDTGTGIAEADLPRVFDPFFTTKPVGVGTGLGLSVARKIVELHGGAVEIVNASVGGARVTVVLKAEEVAIP